jgi:hypothetical protein
MSTLTRLSFVVIMIATVPARGDRDGDDDDDDGDARQVRIHWPAGGRGLQATLDAAPDGARLVIGAGEFAVTQPLVVAGKHLTIVGAGRGRTRFIGPAPQPVVDARGAVILPAASVEGVWSFVGANVTIARMTLVGFDAGIVTTPDAAGLSGATIVHNVDIADTGRGILALADGDLTVTHSTISNTRWNGISFAPVRVRAFVPTLHLEQMKVVDPANAAIHCTSGNEVLSNVIAAKGKSGGLVAIGCTTDVGSSLFSNNTKMGIQIAGGTATIHDTKIINTHSDNGVFGDGINLFDWNGQPAYAVITDCSISYTERAGVSVFGSDASLANNTISCAAFDLDGEADPLPYAFHDNMGNVCGCPAVDMCKASSSQLAPPPPVGGLE